MSFRIKIDAADRFFSLFVRYRANWKCERCRVQYQPGDQGLHCSHFWSRGRESTRFDPDNANAHCFACHQYLGSNPEEFRAWKLKQLGEAKYKALMVRANSYKKKDRKLAKLIAKDLYEQEKKRFETREEL